MAAQIVSFTCILKNTCGEVISSSVNREVLTTLQNSEFTLNGLAQGLQDISKGEKRSITLSAEHAYGFYDPKKVILYPLKNVVNKARLRVGEHVKIQLKSGKTRSYRVAEVFKDMVSLDGNHPLAGQDLIFEIEALEARKATEAEIFASLNPVSIQILH